MACHDDLTLIRTRRSADELLERLQQHHDLGSLPPNTLIFLDEIQEHPEAFAWLRFFHEDHPELAVIAAGSLLEVRLRGTPQPFPVGRVEFLRLEPLTFLEFLRVTEGERLASDLEQSSLDIDGIPAGLHHLATERFRRFLTIGGLPEAVEVRRTTGSRVEVGRVHEPLRQAYAPERRQSPSRDSPRYRSGRFQVRGRPRGARRSRV